MENFLNWLYRFSGTNSWEKLMIIKNKYLPIDQEDKITYIHITGTNGKGSVARYLHQAFLDNQNLKVGLFTSPHILMINERIMINQNMISDADLLRIQKLIAKDVEQLELGFFAILSLISLIFFQEQKVDYAIVEVGIGGLFDATNIIKSDYVVVTSIAKDHQELLGNTLKLITKQKIGIIKPSTKTVFISGNIRPSIQKLIRESVTKPLYFSKYQKPDNYFNVNQSLVFTILQQLFPNISINKFQASIAKTTNLLRFEKIAVQQQIIYFDVAHNLAAIKALIALIKSRNIKIDLIYFSALRSKNPTLLMSLLQQLCPNLVVFENWHKNSIAGKKFTIDILLQQPIQKTILITGSCYFAADVYCKLLQWKQSGGKS